MDVSQLVRVYVFVRLLYFTDDKYATTGLPYSCRRPTCRCEIPCVWMSFAVLLVCAHGTTVTFYINN